MLGENTILLPVEIVDPTTPPHTPTATAPRARACTHAQGAHTHKQPQNAQQNLRNGHHNTPRARASGGEARCDRTGQPRDQGGGGRTPGRQPGKYAPTAPRIQTQLQK